MKRLTIAALAYLLMTSTADAQASKCAGSNSKPFFAGVNSVLLEQFAALRTSLEGARETVTVLRRVSEQACSRAFMIAERQLYTVVLDFNNYAGKQCTGGVDNACRAGFVSHVNARWAREDLTKSIMVGPAEKPE